MNTQVIVLNQNAAKAGLVTFGAPRQVIDCYAASNTVLNREDIVNQSNTQSRRDAEVGSDVRKSYGPIRLKADVVRDAFVIQVRQKDTARARLKELTNYRAEEFFTA